MMDSKRSGDRIKILRCRTTLSKKKRNNNAEEVADDGPNFPTLFTVDQKSRGRLELKLELGQKHSRTQQSL